MLGLKKMGQSEERTGLNACSGGAPFDTILCAKTLVLSSEIEGKTDS